MRAFSKEIFRRAAAACSGALFQNRELAEEGEPEQMTLFEFQADQEKEEKRERLDEALGKIRKKYGENVIQKGILPENDRESR